MGDMGDFWRDVREARKADKARFGVPCPDCTVRLPKAEPKILMPGQKCWCGYKDQRKRIKNTGEQA